MVTIKDIAKATGVSCTTVSNVIHNRSSHVSPLTVEKINNAIKTLGYVPNMSARSLVSNSSKVIGFINHAVTYANANVMDDPFHSTIIGILEQALREQGYYLMLRTVSAPEELLAFLQTWNVDGLFFTGIYKDVFLDILSSADIPIVLFDSYVTDVDICNVGLEDFEGSYKATKYLIDRGHKTIAFASPSIKNGGVIHARFEGYRKALEDAELVFHEQCVFEQEMDIASCKVIADAIANDRSITAIVTTADIMAASIMSNLHQLGIRIPDDISIIGFDDIILSQYVSPKLTTIQQDIKQKGHIAVECMLQLLAGNKLKNNKFVLPTRLIERDSVKEIQ